MSERQGDNGTYGLDDIVSRLEALLGQPHVSEEYIRFRIDLLKAQGAVRQALAGTPLAVPAAGRGGDASPGRPDLGPDTISFDRELLHSIFSAMCQSVAGRGRTTEDIRRLAAAVEGNPRLLEELTGKAAFGPAMDDLESLARKTGVLVDALLFIGRALAAPFVAEAARRIEVVAGAAEAGAESRARCGRCGSPPAVAKLRREDGRRILYCGLCGTSWEFTRLACPWCENCDHAALGVLRSPETDARWVEVCEQCMGYIKTVDERRLPAGEPFIPVVEESATLHLDLLAEKEGYVRRLPYVLSS